MSTRGAIARPIAESATGGWEGRYHHFDSYPTGLGKTLWALHFGFFDRDIAAMTKYLIDDHPAGWSTINGRDLSLTPGFIEYGRKHNHREQDRALCYCHGDRSEEHDNLIRCDGVACTGSTCDPLFIEWAYVLHPEGMSIYTMDKVAGEDRYRHDNGYRHILMHTASWGAEEPHWELMESVYRSDYIDVESLAIQAFHERVPLWGLISKAFQEVDIDDDIAP